MANVIWLSAKLELCSVLCQFNVVMGLFFFSFQWLAWVCVSLKDIMKYSLSKHGLLSSDWYCLRLIDKVLNCKSKQNEIINSNRQWFYEFSTTTATTISHCYYQLSWQVLYSLWKHCQCAWEQFQATCMCQNVCVREKKRSQSIPCVNGKETSYITILPDSACNGWCVLLSSRFFFDST